MASIAIHRFLPFKAISYKADTIHLLIRPLGIGDVAELQKAIKESQKELRHFLAWAHSDLSLEGHVARIEKLKTKASLGKEYHFVVSDVANKFLMSASWHKSKVSNSKAVEIGYWTASQHANKGLATVVTKILTVAAFEFMKCDRVEIRSNLANRASLRVIQKCEFKLEGLVRNYFSEPTPEMLQNGYTSERGCFQYALIPEDIAHLSWYESIKSKIEMIKLEEKNEIK